MQHGSASMNVQLVRLNNQSLPMPNKIPEDIFVQAVFADAFNEEKHPNDEQTRIKPDEWII